MKVIVDAERCNGHARCYAVSEELFPLDDEGLSLLRGAGEVLVPSGLESAARSAADLCPELAISTVD
jgi:ferredoxin